MVSDDETYEERKTRHEPVKDYIGIHDTLDGFDMDKDYTKEYPQENVFRGLEETVQTVESIISCRVCLD